MIAKIVTGASFGGCTAYAYGKDQAEVISHDGIIPYDPKMAAKCFEIQSQLNPRVSKPVGHIAISFKPEDKPRLTNEFMVQIAKEYMEKMGIKDTQYVIVRHHNTPNPHCHLIFNRVDNNGKRISDSNWLKRNVRVCKELKQKYDLTFGEDKSQTRTERLRPNERTRYEMANDVRSALKDSHSWKDFSNNLKTYSIRAEIRHPAIHSDQYLRHCRCHCDWCSHWLYDSGVSVQTGIPESEIRDAVCGEPACRYPFRGLRSGRYVGTGSRHPKGVQCT